MEREEAISYTDMDIEKAIKDFSKRFIDKISLSKTITYATKQLGFKKVVFMAKPTGSEGITDLPNNFLGTRLHEFSFFER